MDNDVVLNPSLGSLFVCLSPDGLKKRESRPRAANKALAEPAAQRFSHRLSTRRILPNKARIKNSSRKGIEVSSKEDVNVAVAGDAMAARVVFGSRAVSLGSKLPRGVLEYYPCVQKRAIT